MRASEIGQSTDHRIFLRTINRQQILQGSIPFNSYTVRKLVVTDKRTIYEVQNSIDQIILPVNLSGFLLVFVTSGTGYTQTPYQH